MKAKRGDERFWEAHDALLARAGDRDDCARQMIEYAEATDDPFAWQMIAARMHDFVERGEHPPFAFVRGISEALKRWRGGEELAVVFGEKRGPGRRGNPGANIGARAWKQTNASMMAYWMDRLGGNKDAAAAKVAELRERMDPDGKSDSVATIKRDFEQFRK